MDEALKDIPTMKIKALAPWFGANRVLAETVGQELGKLAWCGVPFCGGCPELPAINAAAGVASDLHRHIINLGRCIADDALRSMVAERLSGMLFHVEELADAQRRCVEKEASASEALFGAAEWNDTPNPFWAADYFACAWMGRGGHSGKKSEFTQGLSVRWTSSGGDSAKRFQSAIESLEAWGKALHRWSFVRQDALEFLGNVKDQAGHGLYIDPPWPEVGKEYRHAFNQHAQLAWRLRQFRNLRIVVRYGDDPVIRDLYQTVDGWRWVRQESKNQVGGQVQEVLIVNGPSYAGGGQ